MDFKDLIKLATNPVVMGAAGGYFAHKKFGQKYGHWAPIAGSAAGALAGFLINKYVLAPPPAPPPKLEGYHRSVIRDDGRTSLDLTQAPALPPHQDQPEFPEQVHEVRSEATGIFEDTAFGSHEDVDDALDDILN